MTYIPDPLGIISELNSSSTPLAGDDTYTGTWEDISRYSSIELIASSDVAGTLYYDFSTNGTDNDRAIQLSDGTTGNFGIHGLAVVAKYGRVRIVNDSSAQAYLRLQTIYHTNAKVALPTSRMGQSLSLYSDVLNTRSVLAGQTDGGSFKSVPVTAEGHIEIAVHEPRTPFGELAVTPLTPIFQSDAVYGINTIEILASSSGTGSGTASNGMFQATTGGTTIGAYGSIQSRRRLRYRPGQGIIARFTGIFSAPSAGSVMVVGVGHAESGYYFGYNETSFGILHNTGGTREVQTLTVTTASTATNDYVVTLPNTTTVNVTATNNSSTTRTAYEISKGTFPGWSAESRGSTVVFLANSAGNASGTFSLAQTGATPPAAGTCVETTAGSSGTDNWITQANWNGDTCDGNGATGFNLNPAFGNVFQIDIQYLGFGSVAFKIEAAPSGNNADLVTVHTLRFPNTLTAPSVSNPSFPFTLSAANTGSATGSTTVKCASFAGFVAGEKRLTGPRMSYYGTATSSTSAYTPLFTVRNTRVFSSRANQAVVNLLSANGAAKSNTGLTTFYLIKNATLTGNSVNFTQYSTNSCTYWDVGSTGCSFSNNEQIVWSVTISESGEFAFAFADDITLQPGETVTLAVRSVTATATCVGGLNTREDQ